MKKPHKKHLTHDEIKEAHADRIRRRDRRMILRGGVALLVLAPLATLGVIRYQRGAAELRDLSVIGNGQPTVVQVYDYGSRPCRQLRSNVSAVEGEFKPRVQFRLADRSTPDGAILATRHSVGQTTLLMFGADGQLRQTLAGVQDVETIRSAIASSFPGSRSTA
jgi:hypothetical protein